MHVFSASDAVSPAIERTKRYLFRPFEWGTYLKLAAVACVTEGISLNFNYSYHGGFSSATDSTSLPMSSFSGGWVVLIAAVVVLAIVAGAILFYLVTRLRFAFFHCLVHQTKEIRPGWAMYRAQSMRFFLASLVVGLIFLVIVVLAVLPFAFAIYGFVQSSNDGGQFDPSRFLLLFLPLMGIVLLICLIGYALEVVLHDFILPHMALENLSFSQAWTAVRSRIAAETGSFAAYFFLRLVLVIVAEIAVLLIAAIPMLIILGIFAMSAYGFNSVLEDAIGALAFLRVGLDVLLAIVGVGLVLVVAFTLGGPVATWLRNYALLFYGGRYRVLGDILYPPPPPPPAELRT
jgi:hypothetical protein